MYPGGNDADEGKPAVLLRVIQPVPARASTSVPSEREKEGETEGERKKERE